MTGQILLSGSQGCQVRRTILRVPSRLLCLLPSHNGLKGSLRFHPSVAVLLDRLEYRDLQCGRSFLRKQATGRVGGSLLDVQMSLPLKPDTFPRASVEQGPYLPQFAPVTFVLTFVAFLIAGERSIEQMDIAGGEVHFNPEWAVDRGPIGSVAARVVSDREIDLGYVSLKSPNIRISAMDFTITNMGRIWKVGWVNIIQESTREYHYRNGLTVTETMEALLPTWDGGAEDHSPFYFGQWFGTEEEDQDEHGCNEILELNEPKDLHFNDAPCMPPSYRLYRKDDIDLGKFEYSRPSSPPNYMTNITGRDRYLACLTLITDLTTPKVAWCVPWEVVFEAETGLVGQAIDVNVSPNANTTLHVTAGNNGDAERLVQDVMGKSSGEELKRYRIAWPREVASPIQRRVSGEINRVKDANLL